VLHGEKILVTGPAGQISLPLARSLAGDNEVWGIGRFGDPGSREAVEAAGVTTRVCDLATGDFGDLPRDFTYLLHLATFRRGGLDYDGAMRVNAEGTALVLEHCRAVRAALVMSTAEIYKPNADPWHAYRETDPLGDVNSQFDPTYSVSKIAEEAVARAWARTAGVPVVIARMNASYGPNGGLPAYHLDFIVSGATVHLRWDPIPYSPIHQDDINAQTEAMLAAASVPATVVNWGGDEAVPAREWCAYFGELTGIEPRIEVKELPGTLRGVVLDPTARQAITGACTVGWRDGMRRLVEERYPGGVRPGGPVVGQAGRLLAALESDPDA